MDFLSLDNVGASRGTINDLKPLADSQTDLQVLSLQHQSISDVSPLAGLDNLEILRLDGNLIGNIGDLAGQRLIDDGDAGFTVSGDWQFNIHPTQQAFEEDYRFRFGIEEDNAARWQFENLLPGDYEVLGNLAAVIFPCKGCVLPDQDQWRRHLDGEREPEPGAGRRKFRRPAMAIPWSGDSHQQSKARSDNQPSG